MGFFANLFAKAFSDPWIEDLQEKINNAGTDEEREFYENELNHREMMIHYNWF